MTLSKLPQAIYVLFDVFGNFLRARPQPPLKRYTNQVLRRYVHPPETCRTCENRGQLCEVPYCKHWGKTITDYDGSQFCSYHSEDQSDGEPNGRSEGAGDPAQSHP